MTAIIYEPPISHLIGVLVSLLGIVTTARGVRLFARGVMLAVSVDLICGIQACVVAFAAAVCTVDVLRAKTGFLILGALVLAEELYETALVSLVIRFGEPSTPVPR